MWVTDQGLRRGWRGDLQVGQREAWQKGPGFQGQEAGVRRDKGGLQLIQLGEGTETDQFQL